MDILEQYGQLATSFDDLRKEVSKIIDPCTMIGLYNMVCGKQWGNERYYDHTMRRVFFPPGSMEGITLQKFIEGVQWALKRVTPEIGTLRCILDRVKALSGGVELLGRMAPPESRVPFRHLGEQVCDFICSLRRALSALQELTPDKLAFASMMGRLLGLMMDSDLSSSEPEALAVTLFRLCRLTGLLVPHNRGLLWGHVLTSIANAKRLPEGEAYGVLGRSCEGPFLGDPTHLGTASARLCTVLNLFGLSRDWEKSYRDLVRMQARWNWFFSALDVYSRTGVIAKEGPAFARGGGEVEG